MNAMSCQQESRRLALRAGGWNGLDFAEVTDDPPSLCVHFFGAIPEGLAPNDFTISGGRRITGLQVTKVEIHSADDPELEDCLRLSLNKTGDFSTYTLCFTPPAAQPLPPPPAGTPGHPASEATAPVPVPSLPGFDPRYLCLGFRFKQNCPSDLDCAAGAPCDAEVFPQPPISYLAKDYASFRQLMLDRMSLLMPDWTERHIPDLGVAMVELLAYTGDHLSYFQDAVGTEAYLNTARRRISVRRHARMVDYHLHEGCNARAWVSLAVGADLDLDPGAFYLTTAFVGSELLTSRVIQPAQLPVSGGYEVFEALAPDTLHLRAAHNQIAFYTWGDEACCLPKGATEASLLDEAPGVEGRALSLKVGDHLVFEEVIGPVTGDPADADPTHRCVVRLTAVTPNQDPVLGHQVLDIEWAQEDALPFQLCLSAFLPSPNCSLLQGISVARGNLVLVDHGARVEETLGPVPVKEILGDCACEGAVVELTEVAGAFGPVLSQGPLACRQPLDTTLPGSSESWLVQDPRQAVPLVQLYGLPAMDAAAAALLTPETLEDPVPLVQRMLDPQDGTAQAVRALLSLATRTLLQSQQPGAPLGDGLQASLMKDLHRLMPAWTPRFDLLASGALDADFVVEVDNGGLAHLRFGDGDLGLQPAAGAWFQARYRVGGGRAGNVGAEAICFLVLRPGAPQGVDVRPRNPMPAEGGQDPEPMAEAKLFAPWAFRKTLMRAITAADYAAIAARDPRLQGADAALRWTGSWYEARVALDPLGTEETPPALLQSATTALEAVRRMGHDLAVAPAQYVPLDIQLVVCVLPTYLRASVERALLDRFSDRVLPDGSLGFFHPDRLGFGDGIYVSQLLAAAQAVPGVQHVEMGRLERLYEGPNGELAKGFLPLAHGEVAQVDDDPDFPEHGRFRLDMRGGR